MTEDQKFIVGESDPRDFTVDQVNDALKASDLEPTAYGEEVARVQHLEGQADEPRKGIMGVSTPEEPEPQDPNAVKTADQAAPDNVADTSGSYFGLVPSVDGTVGTDTQATKLADTTQPDHLAQTEEARKGYLGETPTTDEQRQALTLSGRKAAREEREANGDQEPGLDGHGDLDTSNR